MSVVSVIVNEMTDFILVCEDLKVDSRIAYKLTDTEDKTTSYTKIKQAGDTLYAVVLSICEDPSLVSELDEIFQDETADIGDVSKEQLVYVEHLVFC